jgi:hypothetical protein
MKLGKRRPDAETAGVPAPPPSEPPAESWTASSEPVVDGEAVELPVDPPAARADPSPAAAHMPPAPAMPFPVAEQPVAVVSSGPEPGGVTPLAESAPAYASGHAAGTAPSWPEPVMELAAERPEVVVGAAFAGGLLFAAILRRLGN